MDGRPRTRSRTPALRWVLTVLVLLAVCSAPGVAAAAPADGLAPGHGHVTPLVDCVVVQGAGVFTAVLGYDNAGTATRHLTGAANRITPAAYDGGQPTQFASGTHHGVASVRVSGPAASWTLDGTTVALTATSLACPPSAQLPAEGNGAGPIIAAVVAGFVGAIALLRRSRRSIPSPDERSGRRAGAVPDQPLIEAMMTTVSTSAIVSETMEMTKPAMAAPRLAKRRDMPLAARTQSDDGQDGIPAPGRG
jgi:hypothetical protein